MHVLILIVLLVVGSTQSAWAQTIWSFGIVDVSTRYQIMSARALAFGSSTDSVLVGVAGLGNTGNRTTMVGNVSGWNNTANNGTFVGFQAGRDNTSGVDNTFIGSWAGQQNTTAAEGVFLGTWAGQSNTTGGGNTYLGYMAGRLNVAGQQNTYVGWGVRSQIGTGSFNTFVGYQTGGETAVSGDHNTAIGIGAGQFNGNWNTAVGQNAGGTGIAFNSTLALGAGAAPTASNQAVIGGDASGNGNITSVYLGQGVTHATPATVTLTTTGGAGSNIAGAAFQLAPGVGTGSATPSSLVFFTSAVGASGTTPQANVERWRIDGAAGGHLTGATGVGLVVPSLKSNSGTRFICVDTSGAFVSQTTACSGT
jgi:trimeric autotransporter adhesin